MDLREKMLDMLETTAVKEQFGMSGPMLVSVSRAVMTNANVYLWSDRDLHLYVRLLKNFGLNVCKVVCAAPKEFQKVDDVEIISPQDLLNDKTPRRFFFVDAMNYAIENPQAFWQETMNKLMPLSVHFISAYDRTATAFNHEQFDVNKMSYYQSHKTELMELFDSLADETSKRALYHYVEAFVTNCIYKGEHNPTRWKYFFGGKHERLYRHLDGECWINCGASFGDTIFAYLSFDFKPKKIYAFEGDTTAYNQMLNNLKLLPPDKRELVEPLNELITAETDFEKILGGNKCTLLNADIEGAELNLLHAMKNVIQADRPVISICVYHFKEDILSIPQFLQSACKDYVYYLRKYAGYYGHLKGTGELTLYAVPVERSLLIAPPRYILIMVRAVSQRLKVGDRTRAVRDKKISSDIIAAFKRLNFFGGKFYGCQIHQRRRKSRFAAGLHFGRFACGRESFERFC